MKRILFTLGCMAMAACSSDVSTPTNCTPGVTCPGDPSIADPQATAVVVRVTPPNSVVARTGRLAFSARVDFPPSSGHTNTGVVWNVQEGPAGGVVTQTGQYTAPAELGTFHVTATSVADPNAIGIATVVVGPSIAVTPRGVRTLPEVSVQLSTHIVGLDDHRVSWSLDGAPPATAAVVSATGRFTPLRLGTFTVRATSVVDPTVTATVPVEVTLDAIPTLAPPAIAEGEVTTLAEDVAFLYQGANPVQKGVEAEAIDSLHAAVVKGVVRARDGAAVAGALVHVPSHPEYGSTRTRIDGAFDFVVNGGARVVFSASLPGYLPAQRPVFVASGSFNAVEDIVMLVPEEAASVIDLTGQTTAAQVATGSKSTDGDGERTSLLIFPPGVEAHAVLQDDTQVPLTAGTLRVTEFTVGEEGLDAMPAELPPGTEYTYAVSFVFDEAEELAAKTVRFNKPVITYVDNFLGFPEGIVVPAGSYDEEASDWSAGLDGIVLRYLGKEEAGLALLDLDADGTADPAPALSRLGITVDERKALANRYGEKERGLWRTPLDHFSTWDLNFGGEGPPDKRKKTPEGDTPNFCEQDGSIIKCEQQVIGEAIPIAGTGLSLMHWSDRTKGYLPRLKIPLTTSESVEGPDELVAASYRVLYEGHVFEKRVEPVGRNVAEWLTLPDTDVHGRPIRGTRPALVQVSLHWRMSYNAPVVDAQSGSTSSFGQQQGGQSTGVITRVLVRTTRAFSVKIPRRDASLGGLGGWQVSAQHSVDTAGRMVWRGDGSHVDLDAVEATVTTLIGNGDTDWSGFTPMPAAGLSLRVGSVATDSSGNVFMADEATATILRRDASGTVHHVAGGGSQDGDGPATSVALGKPDALAVAPNGDVYFADGLYVRRVRQNNVETIAGNGDEAPSFPFGAVPALSIGFEPRAIAVHPLDGSLYVASRTHLVRIDQGMASVVATIGLIDGVTVTAGGTIYISGVSAIPMQTAQYGLWRVDGVRRLVLLNQFEMQQQEGRSVGPHGPLAPGPDDSFYFADLDGSCIRLVSPFGDVREVAGVCNTPPSGEFLYDELRGAATSLPLVPFSIAGTPDGGLVATNSVFVYAISPPAGPGVITRGWFPDEDGRHVHYFDGEGLHRRTVDSLTGTDVLTFGYDGGVLTSITDLDGKTLNITREGSQIALTAPYGQATQLQLDADGRVTLVTLPGGRTIDLDYYPSGLLRAYVNEEGERTTFDYDDFGRLIKHDDPARAQRAFSRVDTGEGFTVTSVSATNESTRSTFGQEERQFADRDTAWIYDYFHSFTDAAGRTTKTTGVLSATQETHYPGGTTFRSTRAPDPRFGMLAPFLSSQVLRTPSGREYVVQEERAVTGLSSTDPSSFATLTTRTTVGEDTWAMTYDRTSRQLTTVSPMGRTWTTTLDSAGRVDTISLPGDSGPAIDYTYVTSGAHAGRVGSVNSLWGTYAPSYRTDGRLGSVTNPKLETTGFSWNDKGFLESITYPTTGTAEHVDFEYDDVGRLTELTPPGGEAHAFDHERNGVEKAYRPPAPTGGSSDASYHTVSTWFPDKRLRDVDFAGRRIAFGYERGGALKSLETDRGTTTYTYNQYSGSLESATAPGGVKTVFDDDGPLLTRTRWLAGATLFGDVRYGYDDTTWRRNQVTVVGGGEGSPQFDTYYDYDRDGLMTLAGDLVLERSATSGRVSRLLLGGAETTIAYDSAHRVERLRTRPEDEATSYVYFDAQYHDRDELGRIEGVTEWNDTGDFFDKHYWYDNRGRLASAAWSANGAGGWTEILTYGYDGNGNRTSITGFGPGGAVSVTASYDDQDRLTSTTKGSVSTTYEYTKDGALAKKTRGSEVTTYQYDAIGNLLRVQRTGGTSPVVVEYEVDAFSRRVGRKVNGVLHQRWLWDGQLRPVAEVSPAGQITKLFVYAEGVNVPEYMVTEEGTYLFAKDHLGSVRAVVDLATGTVVQEWKYGPWGEPQLSAIGGFFDLHPFGFAGGMYDAETGLVRFGARDYDAEVGRWTAKDPIRFHGGDLNLFLYSGADPINRRDPEGLTASGAARGAAIGGTFGAVVGALVGGGGGTLVAPGVGTVGGGIAGGVKGAAWGVLIGGVLGGLVGDLVSNGAFSESVKNPNTGVPGSEVECENEKGRKQTRRYGADGKPEVDTDWDHDHEQGQPHVHDWTPSPGGKYPVRGLGRPPRPGDPGF